MSFSHPRTGSLSPLYVKEYRFFIIARFFYIMALRMVATVVGYQLYQITRDSFYGGLAGLAEFIPVFLLALYAGYLIDRSDKRTLLLRGILLYAVCAVALVAITHPFIAGKFSRQSLPFFFYGVMFGTGVIRSFAGPTSSAIIAQLVPRPILPFAANLSSTTWLAASILGHASAGFFIYSFGVHYTFVIILLYTLIAALFVAFIKKKPIVHTGTGIRAWDSVREGLQYVFRHRVMLGAISLDLFAVLLGGATALIPEIADKILNVGPREFGLLNAAIDIGAGSILLVTTFYPLRRKQGKILFGVVAGFGACIICFGLSSWYWLSFAVLVIAGVLDGISVVIRGTVLQLTTPDEMRGRVSAVNSMFVNSSNELGQFESGLTRRIFGSAPAAVIFGGCMTLVVVLIAWWRAPELKKFEY